MADEEFDVLVVGGGITGAGVALDASARGLKTAIVEAGDWASGTSSRSSKLVHGGLRYLAQREFRLVAQNLAERQRLLRNAPHLVKPLPFLIPMLTKDGKPPHKAISKAYRTALWMYDLAGGARIGHRHHSLDAAEAAALAPGVRADAIGSAFLYWDAWTDDARLTLAIVRTAVEKFGAAAANHARVESLTAEPGRVRARLTDGPEVRARVTVNATGVWADELGPGAATRSRSLRPAKGVHIVVPAGRFEMKAAVVLPVPGDRRSIFAIPWAGRTYIGTTDTDYEGPLDDPRCTDDDVEYLLRAVNAVATAPLGAADVVGRWAGLRPLLEGAHSSRTADLSRRHSVVVDRSTGTVTVTGGKLTTYRAMADDAVGSAGYSLGVELPPCPTRRLRLWAQDDAPPRPAEVSEDTWGHLVGRHGAAAGEVHELIATDRSLGELLIPGLPYLKAEAVWAARNEMARDADDVLERRTRAALLDEKGAAAAAPATTDLIRRA